MTAPRPRGLPGQLALTTSEDPIRLRTSGRPLFISAGQYFHFEPDARFEGEFKVMTDGYVYRVRSSELQGADLFQWHWHPEVQGQPDCHLHVGAEHDARLPRSLHLPSGRVGFEEILAFLIRECDVRPARSDWRVPSR